MPRDPCMLTAEDYTNRRASCLQVLQGAMEKSTDLILHVPEAGQVVRKQISDRAKELSEN